MDSSGETQWQRLLGGRGLNILNSLQETSDGGFVLTGSTGFGNGGDISGHHGLDDIWVVKLNSRGIPLWQKCIGGSGQEYGLSIQLTQDNGYVVCGYGHSIDGDLSGITDYGVFDIYLVKLYGPPMVNGIAPTKVTTGTLVTIVLTGENLLQNWNTPNVTFFKPGTDITLPVAKFRMDGTRITCDITPSTFLSPGIYNVRVMTPDYQYVILPNAFTVTCGPAPKVTSISPATGIQGAVLNPVVIKGSGFWTAGGFTAYLNRTGQPNINLQATSSSATQIAGIFLVPAGAATGKWNLVVRNPDGLYAMKKGAFTVNVRTFKPPRVSSVTPKTVTAGNTVFINAISGSFFNASAAVSMTGPRGISISISNVTVLSDTKITCDANLTGISKGYATITVTNPDGKKSTKSRALTIK